MRKLDEDTSKDKAGRFTAAEVRSAVAALSDIDLGRIRMAARGFSGICGIPAQDLIQEAYLRVLDGRRTCDRGTEIVGFLCGVMKSLASQETEARNKGQRPLKLVRNGEPYLPDVAGNDVSPESAAAAAIDDRPHLMRIYDAIKGDEKLELLLEGILDNMRGAALRDLLDVDERGLDALRQKLYRRLESASDERATR